MNKIRAVIFDIGNVLIHFDAERMLRQVSSACGIEAEEAFSLYNEFGIAYETGTISSEDFFQQFKKISKKNITQEHFWEAFSDIFKSNLDMEPLLYDLKKQDKKILLLSNTCEAHYRFLYQNFEIFKAVDTPILSFEVGARKPEKKIFEAALRAAECSPEECFYTDDIVAYVEAARKLGIRAEPFTNYQPLLDHIHRLN